MKFELITLISLIISITVAIISNRMIMKNKHGKYKLLETAKAKGNVVTGTIASTKLRLGNEKSNSPHFRNDEIRATYHYMVNGITYKKVMSFQSHGRVTPDYPATVQVYYKASNPRKSVCPEEAREVNRRQSGCMLSIIVWFVTMAIVFNILKALFG